MTHEEQEQAQKSMTKWMGQTIQLYKDNLREFVINYKDKDGGQGEVRVNLSNASNIDTSKMSVISLIEK
jgi:hypothetical protein